MPKKITAAIAGACARSIAKRWALRNGLREGEAAALAWLAGAVASAAVMRM